MIIDEYNVSNDNNAIYIYMKLDKIGPNTLQIVPTPTTTTENH